MIEVKLHDIGEGLTQADILSFLVKPGDIVKADEPLMEVQTDKMVAEIPAPAAGIVNEFKVEVGETVTVGTTLLTMLVESNQSANVNYDRNVIKMESPIKEHTSKPPTPKLPFHRIMASPYTRKLARENGINIEDVIGTGPSGRIIDEDVLKFIEKEEDNYSKATPKIEEEKNNAQFTHTVSYTGRRKQIGLKMSKSLYTIPHCTHFEEIDVTNLLNIREEWKKSSRNVSATAYFIKAISVALTSFPIFNSTLDEKNEVINLHEEHHIGVATDTKDGLIVPVIRNVEKKSLLQIHDELKTLTVKAKENKLSMKEMTGSTFTISNVGPLGGSIGATPIINPPEVGLIAFHKTKKRPIVDENDSIVVRSMMNVSMSFDHRVADGATAVAFTNRLTELIEKPHSFMLELV